MEKQEVVKVRRDIYNPYVLNLLYSKVLFLRRLCDINARRMRRQNGGVAVDESGLVIRRNQYDSLVVADVIELTRLMRGEKFRFDLYYANYEYVLYRMLSLFYASDTNDFAGQDDEVEFGDMFGCEIKCQLVVESEEDRVIFTEAVTRYIAHHYCDRLTECVVRARQRATLLFNLKRTVEEAVAGRFGAQRDYTVTYTKDVVTTLLYLLLTNELLSQARLECEQYALRHGSILLAPVLVERGQSAELDEANEQRLVADGRAESLGRRVALLERLSGVLARQYEDEFRGFSVVNAFPEYPSPLPAGEFDPEHFSDYVRSGCVMESVRVLHSIRKETRHFAVREISTENLHYISLQKNRYYYEYITRRFLFDHELLHSHSLHCRPPEQQQQCATCRYIAANQSLFDFYQQVTVNAYHTCHYIDRNSPRLANEALLHLFLAPVIVDLLAPLDSVFYKNGWQVMRLLGEQWIFDRVDLCAVLGHVRAHYDSDEGGSEARIPVVLRQACQRVGVGRHTYPFKRAPNLVAEYHTKLAIDVDMVLCITRAVCHQQNEVETYRRSLAYPGATPMPPERRLNKIIVELTAIYSLYMKHLVDSLEH